MNKFFGNKEKLLERQKPNVEIPPEMKRKKKKVAGGMHCIDGNQRLSYKIHR